MVDYSIRLAVQSIARQIQPSVLLDPKTLDGVQNLVVRPKYCLGPGKGSHLYGIGLPSIRDLRGRRPGEASEGAKAIGAVADLPVLAPDGTGKASACRPHGLLWCPPTMNVLINFLDCTGRFLFGNH